ncbi:MAG TPA: hypothetical protein VEW28_08795 [Candidatus Kapabacteria bacterium]|nr:hypothetical protein [Candidatus Kapabacteria bacterium]
MNGIREYLLTHKKQAAAVACIAAFAGTAYAAMTIFQRPVSRDGRETRMNVILKVPYGSVTVSGGCPQDKAALIQTEVDDPDDQPSMVARYFYNPIGTIGTLRITLGSDEGMVQRPKELALGTWANSGFHLASAGAIETDGGTIRAQNIRENLTPAPAPVTDNNISRILLNQTIPLSIYSEFGFGESLLDMTGLSVMNANIQSSASKAHIVSRSPNPVGMESCTINAGVGECIVDGICNFNCKTFSFSGGIGYCELHFTGNLQKDLSANVEVGCGKVVMNIPPTAGRVQVFYEDNLFSSFSSQGLNKRREGYYTSAGFDQSYAPVLTLRLSSGVGKMVVNYK